ncbi:MAG TPA: quinone-dependent dihydroorotate dehydrogenase [Steroidobacteraceae bacterium]
MKRALRNAAQAALPLLRRLDPEFAHDVGLAALSWFEPLWLPPKVASGLAVQCLGLRFEHPLGLAAGFDKNGDYLDALGALGFSHIELGTVTPRPQPGNPKPRMFRIPEQCALINRMGFNNKGVDHLVARLGVSRYRGIRGISIGKNFDTSLERAHEDYLACLRKVYPHADYVAVNVSSPNTERLRELQAPDGLQRICGTLLEERLTLTERHGKRVPLLVKIAPDLSEMQISAMAREIRSLKLDGVIATNTSTDLSVLPPSPAAQQRGGLSGAPLHALSVKVISQLRAELGAAFPIIGVGGIVSGQHGREAISAGATLLQIYTGFAYRGAALLEEIIGALPS